MLISMLKDIYNLDSNILLRYMLIIVALYVNNNLKGPRKIIIGSK